VPDFTQIFDDLDAAATDTFTVAFLGTEIESSLATDFAEYFLFRFTFTDLTAGVVTAGVVTAGVVTAGVVTAGVVTAGVTATGVTAALELDAELVPKLVVAVTAKL
jgi:hypothetical protein